MKFLYGGRCLDTAKITAQVHHMEQNLQFMKQELEDNWLSYMSLCERISRPADRVSDSNFYHEGSRGSLKHQCR